MRIRITNWSLQAKLMALMVVVLLALSAALIYLGVGRLVAYGESSAQRLGEQLTQRHKSQLESMVEVVDTLLAEYYRRYQQGEFPEDEAQQRALKRISNMRYDRGRGYFWLHTGGERPVMLMHPF